MTLRFNIPGRSENADRPVLGFDSGQIVRGSLLYIEPARDGRVSVPGLGDKIVNWARGSLAALTSEDMGDLDAVMGSVGSGISGAFEQTSKGALHGYFNTAVAAGVAATENWRLDLPQALVDYVVANPTHSYYVDAVLRSTADPKKYTSSLTQVPPLAAITVISSGAAGGGTEALFQVKNLANSTLSDAQACQVLPAASYDYVDFQARDLWQPAPLLSHARVGRSGGLPADFDAEAVGFVRWAGVANSGANLAGGQSFVLYSLYVEDCTVSGRLNSAVRAWREAQVATDFAIGGRYHGEAWTDPAGVSW